MIRVTDVANLERALQCERAILMLHAEWSVPSVETLRAFESWEHRSSEVIKALACELFVAQPDDEFVGRWMKAHPRLKHYLVTGYGEIVWLQKGVVIDILLHMVIKPIDGGRLARHAIKLWGRPYGQDAFAL